jgi:hypothetical protein
MVRNSFLIISKEVLTNKSISATAKLLFAQLLDHRNKRTGQCNPRRKTLADEIGVSVDQVDRAAGELQRAGYLTWKRDRRTAFYELLDPRIRGTKEAQFRASAELDPRIRGTGAPYPLYESYQGEPMRSRAEARSAGGSPLDQNQTQDPGAGGVARKDMGWEIFLDPLKGKFLTKTQMQQLTWAIGLENNRRRNGG